MTVPFTITPPGGRTVDELAFRDHGTCKGTNPDLWWQPGGISASESRRLVARAKAICARCPVIDECLRYAVDHPEAGIWGGATEDERRDMRRQIGEAAA